MFFKQKKHLIQQFNKKSPPLSKKRTFFFSNERLKSRTLHADI